MNPQKECDSLTRLGPRRTKATENWMGPASESGITSLAPSSSWSSQAGERSSALAVTIIRSYGAPRGQPSAPSA